MRIWRQYISRQRLLTLQLRLRRDLAREIIYSKYRSKEWTRWSDELSFIFRKGKFIYRLLLIIGSFTTLIWRKERGNKSPWKRLDRFLLRGKSIWDTKLPYHNWRNNNLRIQHMEVYGTGIFISYTSMILHVFRYLSDDEEREGTTSHFNNIPYKIYN